MWVCVSVRVYPPRPSITSAVILTLNDWLNNSGCFSVPFYDPRCVCHR